MSQSRDLQAPERIQNSHQNVTDQERLPSNQATIDGEGVGDDGAGDGGAGMGLYFCSNGITSR
jgi:hypothetical protein